MLIHSFSLSHCKIHPISLPLAQVQRVRRGLGADLGVPVLPIVTLQHEASLTMYGSGNYAFYEFPYLGWQKLLTHGSIDINCLLKSCIFTAVLFSYLHREPQQADHVRGSFTRCSHLRHDVPSFNQTTVQNYR